MRILDKDSQNGLKRVILYLTREEADELKTAAIDLSEASETRGVHFHISDMDFSHEVTICIYAPGQLEGFSERSVKLIKEDI